MYKLIGADGKEYGPITAEQLRQWVAEGRANAQTKVLAEGSTEWQPLSAFSEFAAHPTTSSAPATTSWGTGSSALGGMRRTNPLALTGMILGILSMTLGLCCCYGFPFNVAGVVCSLIALSQIKANPELFEGRGMAIAGLVLSIASVVVGVVFMLIGVAINLPEVMREIRNR